MAIYKIKQDIRKQLKPFSGKLPDWGGGAEKGRTKKYTSLVFNEKGKISLVGAKQSWESETDQVEESAAESLYSEEAERTILKLGYCMDSKLTTNTEAEGYIFFYTLLSRVGRRRDVGSDGERLMTIQPLQRWASMKRKLFSALWRGVFLVCNTVVFWGD